MNAVLTIFLILLVVVGLAAQSQRSFASTANMALIPGATFEMGTDEKEIPALQSMFKISRAELFAEEAPRHKITIGSFYLDRTEVTNAQFKSFVDRSSEWRKDKIAAAYHNGKYLQHWNANSFPAGQENHPVTFVSWYAAVAFCQDQGKRLPTEAEWEYAARGGLSGKQFPWGDEMPDKTRANYSATGLNAPTTVANYLANGYGLHDMAGNVWEFLADEWQRYPAAATATTDYLKVTSRRALRGGSFGGSPVNLRVTYRDSHSPENAVGHVGFRCAMTSAVQSESVNELLRLHYQDRAAHFNKDAGHIYSQFADEYFSLANGRLRSPNREAGQKGMQAYFDASTFLEWDDIDPPVIRVSDDGSMAYVLVHKKVRLIEKDEAGKPREETEIFAWTTTYRKLAGKWKITSVTSTNTPEVEK